MSGLSARVVLERTSRFALDVEVNAASDRTIAVLGPSGAGKSTLVGALAGIEAIDDGHIELNGRVFDDPDTSTFVEAERRNVGVMFQDLALFPHLDAIGNVAFGLRARGVPKRDATDRAASWLERVGLADHRDIRPVDLSGGQQQRVALARALVCEPDLLLLDEPLSALDVTTRVQLRRDLADHLAHFSGPRVLITHDPAEAFLLADEVYILEAGRITQVGSPDDIRLRPRTAYAADLGGVNLVSGSVRAGLVDIAGFSLTLADRGLDGPVIATIRPEAIALHTSRPGGSPRNVWQTVVDIVEPIGDVARVRLSDPLPLTAEVTADAVTALSLKRGSPVWVSVKATEVHATPSGDRD